MATKKFVNIIWGYSTHMYAFAPEENYHLHALKVARDLGYKTYAIVKDSKKKIEEDPHFDKETTVIEYKNFFQFLFYIICFSLQRSVCYTNSYEWQSFIVPFISRRTIFMAHTQPKRQTVLKQKVQNFVYKFFTAIRLNNKEEYDFLKAQGTPLHKLHIVPLVVSQSVFTYKENSNRKDIVYFGNVTEKKNVPTIIRAFEIVQKRRPEVKFHIVGKIHDLTVLSLIELSPSRENFVLHGFLPNEELTVVLNNMLIYTNSSFDEGQCVAVYDAALAGCVLCLPKIMSFIGVFKNTSLQHDVTDHLSLAQNILTYMDSPEIAQEHRKENIRMITSEYSIDTIERKMRELFLNI